MNDPAPRSANMALELERLLQRLAEEHERLALVGERRRRAIAGADLRALTRCVSEENDVVQRIASLDKERDAIAARAASRFGPPPGVGANWRPTLSWIADRLAEPDRSRLLSLAAGVRALIERVREEGRSAQQAAETLGNHMRGILRAVDRRMSHSGAYSNRGVVEARQAVLTSMDLVT